MHRHQPGITRLLVVQLLLGGGELLAQQFARFVGFGVAYKLANELGRDAG